MNASLSVPKETPREKLNVETPCTITPLIAPLSSAINDAFSKSDFSSLQVGSPVIFYPSKIAKRYACTCIIAWEDGNGGGSFSCKNPHHYILVRKDREDEITNYKRYDRTNPRKSLENEEGVVLLLVEE